jgi:hypothetical protein
VLLLSILLIIVERKRLDLQRLVAFFGTMIVLGFPLALRTCWGALGTFRF